MVWGCFFDTIGFSKIHHFDLNLGRGQQTFSVCRIVVEGQRWPLLTKVVQEKGNGRGKWKREGE